MTSSSNDLTRTMLAILFISGLIALSFLVVRPFAASTVWAATLVLPSWSLMRRIERSLGSRRWAAVTVMTLVLLLLIMIPLSMAISSIASHAPALLALSEGTGLRVPPPPSWLSDIPILGSRAAERWRDLQDITGGEIAVMLSPYARTMTGWFLDAVGGFGSGVLQVLLTIAIAAILYAKGEAAADWCRRFGRRLAGQYGEEAVILAGQAVRGVALGVVVTALVQSLLAGLGLVLAGVPQAGLLTAVTLFLCIAQLGPGLVLLPTIVWLFATGDTLGGVVLVVIGVPTLLIDNILRPVLIRRGADLPLLLILLGVIGGLLAFGMIGLFVGPVILAVTHTLLQHWMARAGADLG
jgi:predicted PurR-regulated permease PerM